MSHGDDLGHGDIEAALAARRELGARYDAELVDGFAERIERAVERRAAERGELQQRRTAGTEGGRIRQFVLGLISLGVVRPDHASCRWSPTDNGLLAVIVAWLGIGGGQRRARMELNGPRRRD